RAGLAGALWQLGQRQEAIKHYQEMLRLNPGDNQGIRYTLLTCLLEEEMNEDARQLLAQYEGDMMATWRYNEALLLFREEGASRSATAQLREAVQYNPHVPEYLLGRKRMPRQLPPYVGLGDEAEAAYYVAEAGQLWLQQDGAMNWLRQVVDETSS
ncbi:MAG TPA: tetratricopeptide repeat protein, partial [Anaerolineae bacterium]